VPYKLRELHELHELHELRRRAAPKAANRWPARPQPLTRTGRDR